MESLRCFLVGPIFVLAILLAFGVPVHMIQGIGIVIVGVTSGELGVLSASMVAGVMVLICGYKLFVARKAILLASKYPDIKRGRKIHMT